MSYENALFYTLSTITQSLGGAIALLGSFVLLRFQIISSNLHLSAKTVIDATSMSPQQEKKVRRFFAEGRYGMVRLELSDQVGVVASAEAEAAMQQIGLELKRRLRLLRDFGTALITSIILMGCATAGLALVPKILACDYAVHVLTIAVLAFIGTLVQFGTLLHRQLNYQARDMATPDKTK